jgi:NAD(P)-dependent dehydrogenase (short-subunit alcohol dehydrogenase family)
MSKIIVVGATGTIGQAVAVLLAKTHAVVRVGFNSGDATVDLGSKTSIVDLVEKIGSFDAVVCAAGASRFGSAWEASDDDFKFSIQNKLMGQVNLVRAARHHISTGGSITLTSGMLARSPWPGTAPTAMVNAGLEGFTRAAALDLAPDIRINIVSPVFVTETARQMGMDTTGTLTAADTAKAYGVSLEGDMTGQVLDVQAYA